MSDTQTAIHRITGTESVPAIVWASALGVAMRWVGCVHGLLFAPDGSVIGSYHPYVSGSGWSIHTRPYGGYAKPEELEFTTCTCDQEAA